MAKYMPKPDSGMKNYGTQPVNFLSEFEHYYYFLKDTKLITQKILLFYVIKKLATAIKMYLQHVQRSFLRIK